MLLKDVREQMIELWEKTFHDSKEYISLVFDTYFNEKYIAYHEHEEKIVSSLLGVPYEFGYGSQKLKGLYLCGLATEEKFRHKGLMSDLLEEINNRVSEDFDFTFLIPSSDLNADYYRRRGYFNSFFRLEERYTSIHDFKNDFILSLNESDKRLRELKLNLFNSLRIIRYEQSSEINSQDIINFIQNREKKPKSIVNLCHSQIDLEAVIKENMISGQSILISLDSDNNITGVAFIVKEEMKRIKLPAVYVEDRCSYFAILNYIKKAYNDYSMSVFVDSYSSFSPSIIDDVYGAENPQGSHLETLFGLLETQFDLSKLMEPYGMVRLLRFDNIIQYLAILHKEIDFKLYLRNWKKTEVERKTVFIVKNGNVKIEEYNSCILDRSILNLSIKEFSELLLRKKDSNSLIMEAFGIPRLILEMKLLLD